MPFWSEVLATEGGSEYRTLDVCCGTGRWHQAFHDLLPAPAGTHVTSDFIDLCGESIEGLERRLDGLSTSLPGTAGSVARRRGTVTTGDACDLSADGDYSLVVNMHGKLTTWVRVAPALGRVGAMLALTVPWYLRSL